MNKKIVVAVSGYFDPIHYGHIEYFQMAKMIGDHLVVIINNNNSAINKKGFYFMDENERLKIVESIRYVDEAIISVDTDGSVAKTLELIKPDIFAKGGDRSINNIPQNEVKICKKMNIKIIDNLGNKIQSSSNLINNIKGKI
ncbi:adenylyltransferase/cytidyltransferase family protein [Staphylococcus nepalensis]|uniref:adenylyltransferase/cytidyltransferase family protein n=1 Tax=Staphylococcus nepalensis TaxID=214473 RepID=UPI0024BA2DFC|nr:adenylyltransferase/cytidyltransferase family protein [Staphylococcus nepalensis]